MLDDLLGRTALKEEIERLEVELAEYEDLQERLDRETRKRKEAVTDRQEAEREVNRLEDRIEQLEDRVERLQSDETTISIRREETLRGRRLGEILDRLESFETSQEGALTAFIQDGTDMSRDVREAFGERAALVRRAAPCLALTDDAGLIAVCLRPPVAPEPFVEWGEAFSFEREWVQPRGRYTLALVRSDVFAMGTYVGDERTAFQGFDSELKSKHSKGGFSQARFERLRDEQIDNHLDRCRAALEDVEAERLFVVGEQSVLGEVMHLAGVTAAVDATGDPEEALDDAWQDFWSVQVRIL